MCMKLTNQIVSDWKAAGFKIRSYRYDGHRFYRVTRVTPKNTLHVHIPECCPRCFPAYMARDYLKDILPKV